MSKSKNILQLQKQFASHIFDKKDVAITKFTSYSSGEALARLNIYRNNVLGNFESVLSSIFIVTKKILGEKKFTKLVLEYSEKFPSKTGNLDDFGNFFPQFIGKVEGLYLKDLAQLELLYHHSYFAAETKEKFNIEKFKKLPPEKFFDLTFKVDSSCVLFATKFPIFSIWQNSKKSKSLPKPEFMLVYSYKILKLSEEEFLFLSLIQKGKKLYDIYKSLNKKTKKEIDVGGILNKFISNGVIINYA